MKLSTVASGYCETSIFVPVFDADSTCAICSKLPPELKGVTESAPTFLYPYSPVSGSIPKGKGIFANAPVMVWPRAEGI